MNYASHINSLKAKKNEVESDIEYEMKRPLPNFLLLSELKRRKLNLKEEITNTLMLINRQIA